MNTSETFDALKNKHGLASNSLHLPDVPNDVHPLIATDFEVEKSIKSFRKGSAAGIDGLSP